MSFLRDAPRIMDMVPYDFFSPWVSVTIVLSDGSEFPLWQGTGFIEDGSAAKLEFKGTNLAVLQEVLVEWQGMAYLMTINLSPNYDDAIKIVDSYLIQTGVTFVVVKMGFLTSGSGPVEQVFNGVIETVDFSIGTEISLTLRTVPMPMVAAKAQESDKQNGQEPWNNMSPYAIIKELWEGKKQGGLQYKVTLQAEDSDPGIQLLKTEMETFSRGSQTDWAIIRKLVETNHCVALADGATLLIDSHLRSVALAPPVSSFHLFSGGALGGNTYAYPITSVSLKSSDMFARSLQGRLVVGYDAKTGLPKKVVIALPNSDETGSDLGAQGLPKDSSKPGGGPAPDASVVPEGGAGATLAKDPSDKIKLRRDALSAAINAWKHQGIELEIETLLIPHLVPHISIDVSGLGHRIDGRYWISKLFFQVGPDGGLTRFECVRTGVRAGPGQAEPLAAQTNQAPEAEAVGGSTEAAAISEDGT